MALFTYENLTSSDIDVKTPEDSFVKIQPNPIKLEERKKEEELEEEARDPNSSTIRYKLDKIWSKVKNSQKYVPTVKAESQTLLLKESLILQYLESCGVTGIPRVLRDENGIPLSQSGIIEKSANEHKVDTLYTSVGIERINGETWENHLFKSSDEIVDAITQAARILASCEKAHIAHGDIKPQNLMMDGNNVYVIDFDNAERINQDGNFDTKSGSPVYGAPERESGSYLEDELLQRISSDIYSLTITMMYLYKVDVSILGNQSIDALTRKSRLTPLIVNNETIPDKIKIFLLWNSGVDPLARDQSYDEFLETLKIAQDEGTSYEDFYAMLNSRYMNRASTRDKDKPPVKSSLE